MVYSVRVSQVKNKTKQNKEQKTGRVFQREGLLWSVGQNRVLNGSLEYKMSSMKRRGTGNKAEEREGEAQNAHITIA